MSIEIEQINVQQEVFPLCSGREQTKQLYKHYIKMRKEWANLPNFIWTLFN